MGASRTNDINSLKLKRMARVNELRHLSLIDIMNVSYLIMDDCFCGRVKCTAALHAIEFSYQKLNYCSSFPEPFSVLWQDSGEMRRRWQFHFPLFFSFFFLFFCLLIFWLFIIIIFIIVAERRYDCSYLAVDYLRVYWRRCCIILQWVTSMVQTAEVYKFLLHFLFLYLCISKRKKDTDSSHLNHSSFFTYQLKHSCLFQRETDIIYYFDIQIQILHGIAAVFTNNRIVPVW